jgi:hypothetical protein
MIYPSEVYTYNYTQLIVQESTNANGASTDLNASNVMHVVNFVCSELHEDYFEMFLYVSDTYVNAPDGTVAEHYLGYPDMVISKIK